MNKFNTCITAFLVVSSFTGVRVNAQYISTFAGHKTADTGAYAGDGGLAINAQLNSCTAVAVDGAGNVYIADKGNNVVRKVNTAGIISTFAGIGAAGFGGNGGNATAALLNMPTSVATDGAGNLYISDQGNNRIRKVTPFGIISTFAGNGIATYTGDADSAHLASINGPEGIAVDVSGNLLIADAGNHVIRRVSTSGIISTVAGSGVIGNSGDGGSALAARLYNPSGIATDVTGNIYIADVLNNKIRKVSSSGVISTFAGTGTAGNTGNGGAAVAASLRFPSGVATDGLGNVYIADQGNYNVRVVTASGVISNYAGTSTSGYDGDGGLATSAKLGSPKTVYVDGWGRVYIADNTNHVIRTITSAASVGTVSATQQLSVFPNPTTGDFTISMPSTYSVAVVSVTDILGKVVFQQQITNSLKSFEINLSNILPGNYIVSLSTDKQEYKSTLVKE